MQESSVFWLRVASALYFLGLIHAVMTLLRRSPSLFRPALSAFFVAVILHLVSLVELARAEGSLPAANFYQTTSLCAFFIALVFLFVWWRFQFAPLSIFLFPLVFLMSLVGATQLPVAGWASSRLRDGWLMVHVLTILLGLAFLLLSAGASLFYIVRERQLKLKRPSPLSDRLPPLGTLDDIVTRSLVLTFVFLTCGVITGLTWAFVEKGTGWIGDARINVALITWAFCLVTVFLRNTAGWRGRKAAMLSIALTGCAAFTWATHTGLRNVLDR